MANSRTLRKGDLYHFRKGVMTFFFKNLGFPGGEFSSIVREYGNALINSNGGFLVFGVDNVTGRIIGLNITRESEDSYRLALDRELRNFHPTVGPNLYRITVTKLGYTSYIVEVRISAGPIGVMFQNATEKVYIIKNSVKVGPLWPQELKALIIRKYQEELFAAQAMISSDDDSSTQDNSVKPK